MSQTIFKTLTKKIFFQLFFKFKLERLFEKCPSTLTATDEMFLVSIFFMRQMQKKLAISDIQYWQHFDSMRSVDDVNEIYYQTKSFMLGTEWNVKLTIVSSSFILQLCSICEHPYPPRLILSSLYVNEK